MGIVVAQTLLPFKVQTIAMWKAADADGSSVVVAAGGAAGVQLFRLQVSVSASMEPIEFLEQFNVCVCSISDDGSSLVVV